MNFFKQKIQKYYRKIEFGKENIQEKKGFRVFEKTQQFREMILMRDSCKGIPLNGTPEHLRDVVAYFAEQLGFEVVYEELVPQEEQNNKEKKKE